MRILPNHPYIGIHRIQYQAEVPVAYEQCIDPGLIQQETAHDVSKGLQHFMLLPGPYARLINIIKAHAPQETVSIHDAAVQKGSYLLGQQNITCKCYSISEPFKAQTLTKK